MCKTMRRLRCSSGECLQMLIHGHTCVPFINFQAANTALVNIQVLREKWKSKAESSTGYRNWGKC